LTRDNKKIKIVHTNGQSNLRSSCQSIFSLSQHHPTLECAKATFQDILGHLIPIFVSPLGCGEVFFGSNQNNTKSGFFCVGACKG